MNLYWKTHTNREKPILGAPRRIKAVKPVRCLGIKSPLIAKFGWNAKYYSGDQLSTLIKSPERSTEVDEETTHTALYDMGVSYAD